MDEQQNVTVRDLVQNTALRVVWGENHLERPITVPDIARPGLQLTGFWIISNLDVSSYMVSMKLNMQKQ